MIDKVILLLSEGFITVYFMYDQNKRESSASRLREKAVVVSAMVLRFEPSQWYW